MTNANLLNEIKANLKQKFLLNISKLSSVIVQSELNDFFMDCRRAALQEVFIPFFSFFLFSMIPIPMNSIVLPHFEFSQFDTRRIGNEETTKSVRNELKQELNKLHSSLIKVSEAYHKHLNSYANSLNRAIDDNKSFFDESTLMKLCRDTRNRTMAKVI